MCWCTLARRETAGQGRGARAGLAAPRRIRPPARRKRMGFRRRVSLGLVLGLVWACCWGIVPASAATAYTIMAGGESSDLGAQVNVFAPSTVTVSIGDTVTWKLNSTEFHTVTFLSGAPRPDFVEISTKGPAF